MHYKELKQAWAELTAPGAPFEISEIEVRGVNIRTYKNAPPSVRELWLSTAQFAEREYLVYENERLTYAEAYARPPPRPIPTATDPARTPNPVRSKK